MTTLTIPKISSMQKNNLIAIPRQEYEEFLKFKKIIRFAQPTKNELKSIQKGRKEISEDRYALWHKLKQELENYNR